MEGRPLIVIVQELFVTVVDAGLELSSEFHLPDFLQIHFIVGFRDDILNEPIRIVGLVDWQSETRRLIVDKLEQPQDSIVLVFTQWSADLLAEACADEFKHDRTQIAEMYR